MTWDNTERIRREGRPQMGGRSANGFKKRWRKRKEDNLRLCVGRGELESVK